MDSKKRAFELDALRGLALFLMVLHHTAYDLRYIFDLNILAFQERDYFWAFIQPFFVCVFVVISGICCQFSRSNPKRALKLLVFSVILTTSTVIVDRFFIDGVAIYFNIIHLLTVGTALFALFDWWEQKSQNSGNKRVGNAVLLLSALTFLFLVDGFDYYDGMVETNLLIPFGIQSRNFVEMGDYLPMVPWLGVFIIGVLLGRFCYEKKETFFPNAPSVLKKITKPFEFIGRHSLLVYLIHQPIVLGILYLLRLGGII